MPWRPNGTTQLLERFATCICLRAFHSGSTKGRLTPFCSCEPPPLHLMLPFSPWQRSSGSSACAAFRTSTSAQMVVFLLILLTCPQREQFAMQLMRGTQRRHPCRCRFCVLIIVLVVGMGVEQDVEEAMKWLTMAATSGNSLSHYELGTVMAHCDRRPPRAATNSLNAMLPGQMYYDGSLVPKDEAKANEHFVRAADLDNPNAQFWMGAYSSKRPPPTAAPYASHSDSRECTIRLLLSPGLTR